MALVVTDDKHYKAIAGVIRAKTGTDNTYKASDMAEGVESACYAVYADAKDVGYWEGYGNGYNEGKQGEWSEFWDSYQQNGKRTYYANAFSYQWTDSCFKPKHDMKPTNASKMFDTSNITDVQACLDKVGTKLDFSDCSNFDMMLSGGSSVTRFGTIDTRSSSNISGIFNGGTNLQTVDLFILKDDGSQTQGSNRPFASCNKLANIVVQGKFGFSFSMEWCPLSKESIYSIINALFETASGKTLTLPLSTIKARFETSSGANDGNTSEEWLNLVASKQNWTITLV